MTIQTHVDKTPGLTMDGIEFEEVHSEHGQHYFKVTQKIGSLFGHEVEGEISAMGSTKEIALANLAQEQEKLYESLWV